MKIQSLNTQSSKSKKNNFDVIDRLRLYTLSKRCDKKMPSLNFDVVELSPKAKIQQHAKRIYSRTRKFNIKNYNALSSLEKSILREASYPLKTAADDSLRVGLKVKEKLDTRYGKDNYVFGCIGTSPSGVARVLEFSGVEVKYLPISRLNWLDSLDGWKKHSEKFDKYQKFLCEQGLAPERVAKSNKKFLFYDFVQQGMSLMVFERMMKEHFGLNLPNVGFHNFNYLCQSACAKNIDPPQYSLDYIEKYMNGCGIEEIGGVPHLDIAEIDKIDECKKYENLKSKMFNFLIIDELAKKGLLKENLLNKKTL